MSKMQREVFGSRNTAGDGVLAKSRVTANASRIRRFGFALPWFNRSAVPIVQPLRSAAREFEELFHPFD